MNKSEVLAKLDEKLSAMTNRQLSLIDELASLPDHCTRRLSDHEDLVSTLSCLETDISILSRMRRQLGEKAGS